MKFLPTTLDGVWLIELEPRQDERGFLARTYCEKEFANHGLNTTWLQCNWTLTRHKGMIRGMHYQLQPRSEIKLIRCLAGSIFDVLVDMRKESPTCGRWEGFNLDGGAFRQLYVPGGLAHGFQCLTDDCQVFYQMSEFFDADLARGIRWNSPALNIAWPIPDAVLSDRDRNLPVFE